MIEELSIRDLGVIAEAKLEFSKGFTVVSGETGAGKTMVLTALGLLLGDRADAGRVRVGSAATSVEGRWYLGDEPSRSGLRDEVAARLDEAGIPFDGELILSRQVSGEGRSKAVANGRAIPVSMFNELGEQLVVVHGQTDQQRLRGLTAQREALDNYGGADLGLLLARYSAGYEAWRSARRELEALKENRGDNLSELKAISETLAGIEKLQPVAGEFARLSELAERLGNLEATRTAVNIAHEALSSSSFGDAPDAVSLLGLARRSLEPVASADSRISTLVERLHDLTGLAADLVSDLARVDSDLEADAELTIDDVQERRALYIALGKRNQVEPDGLIALAEQLSARALAIDSSDEALEVLETRESNLQIEALALARQLSQLRRELAQQLAADVTAELAGLAMPTSRLVVDVVAGDVLKPWGIDEVSILLAAAGGEPRQISKSASGGELSRIMLAIEVVLAKNVQSPTFIFDEVDAGVGGAAAIEIGRRLAQLAKQAQVIVVTHLAQVAAFADRHIRVMKFSDDGVTSSDVTAMVGEEERLTELARMLSGLSDSMAARANAAELVALARQTVE